MRVVRFAIVALLAANVPAHAQASGGQPLGLRFFPSERIQFGPQVSATDDGLVAITFGEQLLGPDLIGKESREWREVFLPSEVLDWANRVDSTLRSGNRLPPEGVFHTLGHRGGVAIRAQVTMVDGVVSAVFHLNYCVRTEGTTSVSPEAVKAILATFRRAAAQAGAVPRQPVPDDAVWYGHAIGCQAIPAFNNAPPRWPRAVTELRPHQELMQFVVNANGRVEPGSERFFPGHDPRFTAMIREVLPEWRFTPATRMALPVRQLVHVNVGFAPPLVLDASGRECPRNVIDDMEVSPVPGRRPPPSGDFLRDIAAAFGPGSSVLRMNGATVRLGYDRARNITGLQITQPVPDSSYEMTLRIVMETMVTQNLPALPDEYGNDTVFVDVRFPLECQQRFGSYMSPDFISVLPLGDGTVRLSNTPEGEGGYFIEEAGYGRAHVTVPAAALRQFAESAAALVSSVDTSRLDRSNAALEVFPRSPSLGTPGGNEPGVHLWLSGSGDLLGGFGCGDIQTGQRRLLVVTRENLPKFRDVVRESVAHVPLQPRWARRTSLPALEHEMTCQPSRVWPASTPAIHGRQVASVEVLARFIVDANGLVEPTSVETMPGPDSATRRLVESTVKAWTFNPGVAGNRRVRAQTHANVVVRPSEQMPAILAVAAPEPPAARADTASRTVFFRNVPEGPREPDRLGALPSTAMGTDVYRDMQQYTRMALDTWPSARERFTRGLPLGQSLLLTVRLHEQPDRDELAYVTIDNIVNGTIHGHISSDVLRLNAWRRGDRLIITEPNFVDWTIVRADGSLDGNFVGRFLDRYRTPPTR